MAVCPRCCKVSHRLHQNQKHLVKDLPIMTGNYKSLVQKICPNAEVIVDRFHLVKIINEELNSARIAEKKTAESLNVQERAKLLGS